MKQWKAHAALAAVALIYGLNYIVAKEVMPHYLGPRAFILLRVVGASILFFLFSGLVVTGPRIARADWPRVFLCGMFGVAGNQLLFFEGLSITTPINASVIMTANPVLVLLMSAALLKEPLSRLRIAGVVLGAAGALVLILGRGELSLGSDSLAWGNLLILLNASSYALYLVLVKPLMRRYEPLQVIRWVFLCGAVVVIPIAWPQFQEVPWHSWDSGVFLKVGYVVVFTTFLAYLFNVFALKSLRSSTVSMYIYLQPLIATLAALALARDRLDARTLAAAAMIFAGVYLVSRR